MRYFLVLIVGLFLGIVATKNQQINSLFSATQKTAEPEVLYWVAPMDANYQRDKPGKSPMGMDLVPVYAEKSAEAEKAEPKILYWVAPMDANYQRDKPGKSPMGMDLVPVFEEAGGESEAGLVKISPAVENNLGVRTGKVVNAPLNISINTLGTVQANENALWQINSRVSGWIEKLYVKSVGVEVEKGQALFDLYSPELVKAQESLFNAINLNRSNLITSSKARLQALGVNQDQIENIIRNKKVLQNITVFAPQKGTISELKLNEGAFISPSTVVITAVNLDTVWVDVEVFAAQVSLVKLGDLASMTLDYFPGQKWEGQVDFIYPEMNASNRTLRVRLQFDNPTALLKPNMFASVTLIPQMKQRTLQIPREAVIYAGNMNRVVLALGEGNFKSVLVNLGLENKKSVEVLSGLSEGQEIVTSAQFLLDSESSISADFGRMLELDKNKQSQPESDSIGEDEDLDWLDLGEQSDFGLSGNNTSGPVARKVTL
ncbi:efflux transporter, RND family, MFP subunit [Psychromonas ingrahamii 37]|uniref:Efflux transporter, RND family, MFP subunit n=1 Tax=Psychromonas ingrahamii (strain DSM 17664 / CCUG 51855 / 37) TaxID=357804 RepID=A1SUM5_PSYIN|nr:efflux RND transporter periplasmic adaptor subunit [Psychromonas ingrahamii]ABM03190.1 efflux transporter, RND family, MFP subunit [Psychromonas ingrahamii 37]